MKFNAFKRGMPYCGLPPKLILVMKITVLLLFTAIMSASAATFGQKITLSEKNASLESVLKKIRLQSGYDLVVSADQIKSANKVSLTVEGVSVEKALELCFKDQPLSYEVSERTITVKLKETTLLERIVASFSMIDVSGRVVDEKVNPVPGARVRVTGKNGFVLTDNEGRFSFTGVAEDALIEISSLGYKKLEMKVAKNMGDIQLEPEVADLDQVSVVSTGYQSLPKERATGSFVKIDNATLNAQSGTNILQRLSGVTSGLSFSTGLSNGNPQNTTNISIRGLSTINGPLDPLIVLDNFIYEGDINNINPNDIEDITVLKDAAAASIWGARAGNGVIVITSKKGRFNQPLKVAFNSNVIVSEKPNLYYYPQMSSSDYVDVEQFLFGKGYFDNQISSTPYAALTPAVEVFLKRRLGQISKTDSAQQINALKMVDSRDEYLKYFYHRPLTQQYAMSLSGGAAVNSYNISGAYDRSSSEVYNTSNKVNLKADHTFRPVQHLTVATGIYFTQSSSSSGRPSYGSIQSGSRRPGYFKFADDAGNPIPVATAYREAYTDTAGNGKLLNWRYYPLEDYLHNNTQLNQQEIYANAGLNYKLFSFLSVDAKYQYQKQSSENENLSDIESYNTRNRINSFSQLNRTTGVVRYIVPLGGIKALNKSAVESHTLRAQLNVDQSWESHQLSFIAGAETRQAGSSGSGSVFYGYSADPLSSSNADFLNSYPNFITGNTESIFSNRTLSDNVYRFVSLYANGSYYFKKRYLLTGSVRRDGSNIFGASTNDRWKPLWSAGIGWQISEETFYKIGWLPYLKLTGTYGISGSVDLSRSALPVAGYGLYAATNLRFARISTINNPELRWEQSAQLNLRLEFATKRQVLSGSIEYYRKKGTDLYGETPYDYTAWGRSSQLTRNVGEMLGKGIDLTLSSRNLDGILKWNSTLLLNYNDSRTTAYYSTGAANLSVRRGGSISPVIGKPLYAIAAYRWGGLNSSGNPQGYVNGALSTDYNAILKEAGDKGIDGNIIYKGAAVPVYFGSLINSFTWKRFSASVNIGYKLGYYLFKPAISYPALIENGIGQADYNKRWQKPGDELITDVPSFVYPAISNRDSFYGSSEANVIKGDHIRLNYVNLGYSIVPKRKLGILPFEQIQLYAIASNLGLLWRANKDHIDPDFISTIPSSRTIALGIRTNF